MDIYIGNLPKQLNSSQLRKIVSYALLPNSFRELMERVFKRTGRIQHGDFEVIDTQQGDQTVRFAHAVIEPDQVARRVVKRLDHLTLQGSSLRAREYMPRDPANDRRYRRHKNLYAVGIYNRRVGERRKFSRQ